jgi:ABC-type dipeptide/oligopeptide/nickel transport system permease component
MTDYLLRRSVLSVVQLLGLAIGVFALVHLAPGDPVRAMLGDKATPAQVQQMRTELGLNRPLIVQLGSFLGHTVSGRFGDSITFSEPIKELISQRIEPSALLIGYGMLVTLLLGVPMAIVAALRPGGMSDNVIRIVSTATFTMPGFWLALVLVLLFSLRLGLFPVSGYQPGLVGSFRTLTLPAVALGLSLLAVVVRVLRASLRSVLGTDYIEAATARGLSPRRILVRHAMRNAAMPTISVMAVNVGFLVGGTAVLEQVFQIPGVGSLLIQAVERRDYPVVEILALLAGAAVVVAGLTADLIQAAVDPRVRLGRTRSNG